MHARVVLGVGKGVLLREVSSFQRLKCMQEWYLGWENVSCLERCPQFKSVLIEREVHIHSLSASSSFTRSHTVSSRAVQSPCWSGTKTRWSSESATFSKNDLKNMDLKNVN